MKSILPVLAFILFSFSSGAQVVLVSDIVPGVPPSSPNNKFVFKDKLVFFAAASKNHELKSFNDTTVSVVISSSVLTGSSESQSMAVVGDKLYFGVYSSITGQELYSWDGTNTPSLVTDINSGADDANVTNIILHKNKIYFRATTQTHGSELWMHDPATNITRRLSDINPGKGDSGPMHFTVFNNKIFFAAWDGSAWGAQLYQYDPVTDVVTIAPNYNPADGLGVGSLSVCYNKLYYVASSTAYGDELYAYDGSNAPIRVTDINPGSGNSFEILASRDYTPSNIIGFKGYVFFAASTNIPTSTSAIWLYKYDPNAGVGANNPAIIDRHCVLGTEFFEFNGRIYYMGYDTTHGIELWNYDGINAPAMVADINPMAASSAPRYYTIYRNNLYFSATGKTTGEELYKLGFNTGIENISRVSDVRVYPIPATDILHFYMNLVAGSYVSVALYDVNGREVYNSGIKQYLQGDCTIKINVAQLTAGNYYYQVKTQEGAMLTSGKVIKQ